MNRLIESGAFAAALDPTKTLRTPARREVVPHFNFAPLHNALARIDKARMTSWSRRKSTCMCAATATPAEVNSPRVMPKVAVQQRIG